VKRYTRTYPTIDKKGAAYESDQQVHVKQGLHYVEEGRIATARGLTSGIDLAWRIVDRYYGRAVAQQTAESME